MGKMASDTVLDQMLTYIRTTANRISVCETQPTSYTEATTNKGSGGYKLAIKTISSTDFDAVADGDTNGRKVRKKEDAGITVDVTGSAQHVALSYSTSSLLMLVTTCATVTITATNLITIPVWDMEIADPT